MRISLSRKAFVAGNYIGLYLLALLCILPLWQVLAISVSSRAAAESGMVTLWPIGFHLDAYKFALQKPEFLRSIYVSAERVALGWALNMAFSILTAYPLSKEVTAFRWRTVYVWIFFVTILFGGGLIPSYMIIRQTGLIDSIWALIVPTAVPVFAMVLLLNFFRGLPKEIEESALIDGAGHLTVAFKIYVPLSLPALATLSLMFIVGHWNSWLDGMIYMNSPDNYPLQTYLKIIVLENDLTAMTLGSAELLQQLSDRTFKSAQILIGALPVLIVYPFLQKYFVKGIVLGSVKE